MMRKLGLRLPAAWNLSFWLILAALLLTLAARSLDISRQHHFPVYDEVDYLDLARDFADQGMGPIVRDHFRGRHLEDSRHPLYLMLLSFVMDHTPRDFTRAKLLSLVQAGLFLFVIFFFAGRQFGHPVGLGTLIALGLSPTLAHLSQEILADVLFGMLYFAGLYVVLYPRKSWRSWAAAGSLMALSYLAKGNGYFLLIALLAVGVSESGLRFFKSAAFYVSLGFFCLIASPLLIRNLRVWGNPFYNMSGKVIWLDGWADHFILISKPIWGQIGLEWYLQHHTWADMLFRLLHGMKETLSMLIICMSVGPRSIGRLTGSVCAGFAVFGFYRRWREGRRTEVWGVLSVSVVLLLAFSWGVPALSSNYRYVFPIAVSWTPFAIVGLLHFARPMLASARTTFLLNCLLFCACAGFVFTSRRGFLANPLSLWTVPPVWAETTSWIKRNLREQRFLVSNRTYYSPWECCRNTRDSFPLDFNSQLLREHIRIKDLHAALLDQSLPVDDPLQDKFSPRDRFGPVSFLGWKRCFHDSLSPSVFLIYSEHCPP